MNTNKEFELIVESWLEDRVVDPRPGSLDAALQHIETAPQRPARLLGRLSRRGSGATRSTDDRGSPNLDHHVTRRTRFMFSATGLVAGIAVLALAVSVVTPSQDPSIGGATGGPLVVDPQGGGDFTTINDAVESAEDGDTILIAPGIYDESIRIAKDITIRGDGDSEDVVVESSAEIPLNASCFAPDLPTAFLFEGSDATLENLTVRGEAARIIILGGSPTLRDLVLDGLGRVYRLDPGGSCVPTGLSINEGSTATIASSQLLDVDIDIVTGASPSIIDNEFSVGAIWMQGTGVDPLISGNVLQDSVKWGISISGGARPTVDVNTITGAENAIEIEEAGWQIPDLGTDPIIRGNTINDARQSGIKVGNGASGTIEGNVLIGNQVGISAASDAVVAGNRLEGGGAGIVAWRGTPTLTDNTVTGARTGISIASVASPTLRSNTSCDNEVNLFVGEGATPDIDDSNEICEDAPASDA